MGLYQVQGVVEQLARMIKTHLPLAKESNPFYGHDFMADNEDKAMLRDELWVYDDMPGKGYVVGGIHFGANNDSL